jgi:hypothetical protein
LERGWIAGKSVSDKLCHMTFQDHIGETALFFFQHFKPKNAFTATISSVDSGGLWLESQQFHEMILGVLKVSTTSKKPILFFPYSEIFYAVMFVEGVALSEERLGI